MTDQAKEPLKTDPNPKGTGAPTISDEQYNSWLDTMRPFLRAGNSLRYSMEKCALLQHKTVIYEKYKLNDWFSEKVDAWRATMGEMANNIVFTQMENIQDKMIKGQTALSKEDFDVVKLVAEKHRTAQPFFVTRTETATADPNTVGKILDTLEMKTDYAKLGPEVIKQGVAANTSIQNPEQSGPASDVQPKPDTTTTST